MVFIGDSLNLTARDFHCDAKLDTWIYRIEYFCHAVAGSEFLAWSTFRCSWRIFRLWGVERSFHTYVQRVRRCIRLAPRRFFSTCYGQLLSHDCDTLRSLFIVFWQLLSGLSSSIAYIINLASFLFWLKAAATVLGFLSVKIQLRFFQHQSSGLGMMNVSDALSFP